MLGVDYVWQACPANIIGILEIGITQAPFSSQGYSFLCAWWHQRKERSVEIKQARKSVKQRRKCSDVRIDKSLQELMRVIS